MVIAVLTAAIGALMFKKWHMTSTLYAPIGWQYTIGSILMLIVGFPQLKPEVIVFTSGRNLYKRDSNMSS